MRTTRKTLAAAALAGFALLMSPAIADKKHKHGSGDHAHTGSHGGRVVESGHHHLEVVAKDGVLEIHVTDEDMKSQDVTGAKATAAVLSGGEKEDITLTLDAGVLKGRGTFKAVKGTTIVVTLTMPGHKAEQARIKLD
jgi:hypothetical protein